MSTVKERIIGAVTIMKDEDAEFVWKVIQSKYTQTGVSWGSIEEIEPDEWDLQMLNEIEENPDCNEFVSSDELKKELGL